MNTNGREYFSSVADELAAARECELTVLDFTAAFDAGDYEVMRRTMAEQGVWKRQECDLVGLDQVKKFMNTRRKGLYVRHVITNIRTTFTSKNFALVQSYVTVYRHDFPGLPELPAPLSGPHVVGRYCDQLELQDTGWKLIFRETHVDFKLQ
jgi:hypothetical protein